MQMFGTVAKMGLRHPCKVLGVSSNLTGSTGFCAICHLSAMVERGLEAPGVKGSSSLNGATVLNKSICPS